MNISFKKNINHNYMVIEKVKEFKENNFKVQMLINNQITGLLNFDYEAINGEINFLYDISSMMAFFREFEKRKMTYENIRGFLLSLKTMIYTLDEYLLNPDDVIMKKECIFIDSEKNNYEFCYDPFYNGNIILELRELFGAILLIVDYEDERAVRLAYELFEKTQSENYVIQDLLEVLSEDYYSEYSALELCETTSFEKEETLPAKIEHQSQNVYKGEVEEPPFIKKLSRYLLSRGFMDVLEDINNGEFMDRVKEYGFAEEQFSYPNIVKDYTAGLVKEESDYNLGFEFYDLGRDSFTMDVDK